MTIAKYALTSFLLVYLLPIALAAVLHQFTGVGAGWWTADRSSVGHLEPASSHPDAVVRVFAAPTVSWRGVVAVHSWIVLKPAGGANYTRYDYTAWGDPIRVNGFVPDGRWFGRAPVVVFAADGQAAEAFIPRMQARIDGYSWRSRSDYRVWPGPNSNTFVAAVLDAVPEANASLPPSAIGKDYPYDGRWFRWVPSGQGFRANIGGYLGLTVGWIEGVEVSILGVVAGIDIRRPAVKLPGLGRLGLPPGGD